MKTTFYNLGLRIDNLKIAIFPYLFLLFLVTIGEVLVLKHWSNPLLNLYNQLYPFFWLSVVGSVLQELFFRGYIMYKLKSIFKTPLIVIFVNSLLFAVFHLLIPYQLVVVPLSFLVGLGFATVYYYYPNLYLVSAVHVLINLTIIPFCYLKITSC